jgi:AraC-like DNA-binding protein
MASFAHDFEFGTETVAVKRLRSWSGRDLRGFQHEYEASRISFVRRGLFGRVIRGQAVIADPTQVLLVNAGDVHRFVYPVDGGNTCTVIEPAHHVIDELRGEAERDFRFPLDQMTASPPLARAHMQLHAALGSSGGALAVEEQAMEIVAAVVRMVHPAGVRDGTAAIPVARRREMVEYIRLLLNVNLSHPPTLTTLAHRVGLSAPYISRLFRTEVGITLRSYLAALRATEAAWRVREGASDLGMLALELGYYDHAHLTNAFKARWGCSPSNYRRATQRR